MITYLQLRNAEVVRLLCALGADLTLPENHTTNPYPPRPKRPPNVVYTALLWPIDNYGPLGTVLEEHSVDCDVESVLREVGALPDNSEVHCKKHKGSACACPKRRKRRQSRKRRRRSRSTSRGSESELEYTSSASYSASLDHAEVEIIRQFSEEVVVAGVAKDMLWKIRKAAREHDRRTGVRVLCLDGGGVRGLIQLEMLRQIEEVLNDEDLTITTFFDYIVGTSTGGVMALAMVYGMYVIRKFINMNSRGPPKIERSFTLTVVICIVMNGRVVPIHSSGVCIVLYNKLHLCHMDSSLDFLFYHRIGNKSVKELQQIYLSTAKLVFSPVGCLEWANTEKLEGYLKLWLGDSRMNERSRPK